MALPRISKTHPILCELISKHPISLPITRSQSRSPLSTTVPNDSFLSSGQTHLADGLVSVFSKQPFSPENPELKSFAPFLTAKLVESALNRFRNWKTAHLFFAWASNQHGYRHNCYTYNTMASILSGARQNAALRALALDVVDSNCSMSPGGLGFFLRCLGSLGLVKEANILFDQVKKKGLCVPNDYSYACLLEVLSKSSSVDFLEMRFKEMMDSGWEINKYTLTPLLQAYCNVGEFERALDVFNDMNKRGWVDAHVFSILIVCFSKWGKVDKAFELIKRMEDYNFRLNEKSFRVLINGFVKESRVDKALQLFSKMRSLGFSVDVSLFDVLIGGLCKNRKLEKALCLYKEMKELGIRPDAGILVKLVSCCSSKEEMIQLIEGKKQDMEEGEVMLLYNSVLKNLVSLGSIDKANLLLRAMMGDESSLAFEVNRLLKINACNITSCFKLVIDGLLKTNKLDMALKLFKDMIHTACKPDRSICNNLIDGLCNSNRLEESYEIMTEMKNSGLEPTEFTHNSLYWCLCRREDVAGALDMVKRMRVHGHKPWIKYSSLFVKKLCQDRKVVQACSFLDDMLQEGFPPDIVSYSAVLDSLVKAREVDRAMHLFRGICDRGCCPDVVAYNILINGLCKAQRISEAEDLANEMVVKGLVPSVVTYNLLIDGWCKLGDVDRAMLCLSKMYGANRDPSVITYTTLIDGLCAAGKSEDALMLFDDMVSKGCAPNRITFMALISGLCKCRRPGTALSYLRHMEEKGMTPDSFVYVALLSTFLSSSNLPMVFEILKEMVDKGIIANQVDKNHSVVTGAIHELLADERISPSVKALIAKGSLPTVSFSDAGNESEPQSSTIIESQ